jgi:hypothetical protein
VQAGNFRDCKNALIARRDETAHCENWRYARVGQARRNGKCALAPIEERLHHIGAIAGVAQERLGRRCAPARQQLGQKRGRERRVDRPRQHDHRPGQPVDAADDLRRRRVGRFVQPDPAPAAALP